MYLSALSLCIFNSFSTDICKKKKKKKKYFMRLFKLITISVEAWNIIKINSKSYSLSKIVTEGCMTILAVQLNYVQIVLL